MNKNIFSSLIKGGIKIIYITGDTHCPTDIKKLYTKETNRIGIGDNDYLIIAGDAGFVWSYPGDKYEKEDLFWQKVMRDKKYTTLFVDGNHENFNLLDSMPVEIWNGGKIHKINEHLIHLMRGQIFNIDGKTIFTMGGASSSDKSHRTENINWWKRELPSSEEYEEAIQNLDSIGWKVDYIVSHCPPEPVLRRFDKACFYKTDDLIDFFTKISYKLDFKKWFFGHYHFDFDFDNNFTILFDEIKRLDD